MFQIESFQKSELVGLLMAIPMTIAAVALYRNIVSKYMTVFLIALLFALGASVFTIAEDIVFPLFFNYLEHICYALIGLMLALGCYLSARTDNISQENS